MKNNEWKNKPIEIDTTKDELYQQWLLKLRLEEIKEKKKKEPKETIVCILSE